VFGRWKIESARVTYVQTIEFLARLQEMLSVRYDVANGVLYVPDPAGYFYARQCSDPVKQRLFVRKNKGSENSRNKVSVYAFFAGAQSSC
jgi:hypothetical protein